MLQSGDSTDINNEYKYDYSKPPIYSKDQVVLTNSDIKDAKPKRMKDDYGQIQYVIDITLNDTGKQKFAEVTERNLGQPIYIIYNGDIVSAPYVQSVITDGKTQITGLESQDSATQLAEIINNKNGNIEFVEGNLTWPLLSEDYGNENLTDKGDRENYNHSNISTDLSNKIRNAKLVGEYSIDISIYQMDSVIFGLDENNQPIEWIVLEKSNNKALLLSKYLLTTHRYNDDYADITWENCTMRKWLNSEYINTIFSKKEQGSILTTDVINNNNAEYGTKGGNNTKDKLFLLSIDEVKIYFSNDSQQVATYKDGSSHGWWLRSSGYSQNDGASVREGGDLDDSGPDVDTDYGVRPAMWVSYNEMDNSIGNNDENGNKNIKEPKHSETTSFSFNQKLIDEYNNEENKGKCKFDSEGNLWIESWPYLGSGPGEGVTIKYANGNEEHYEYSGFASAYDGGGHIDIYATEINGVKKDIEVRNENIKDSDKEFVNKIYEMIEKFKSMKNEYE